MAKNQTTKENVKDKQAGAYGKMKDVFGYKNKLQIAVKIQINAILNCNSGFRK